MPRNLVIVNFHGTFQSYNEAAEDEHLLPLGSREQVKAAVDSAFGKLDWSDEGYAELTEISFDVGSDDPVEELVAQVQDGADVELELFGLARENSWHITDSSMGEFIDITV
jgi:hypothetical protein